MKVLFSQLLSSCQLEISVQVYVLTLDYLTSKQKLHLELGYRQGFFQLFTVLFFVLSSFLIQKMDPSVFMDKDPLPVKLLGII